MDVETRAFRATPYLAGAQADRARLARGRSLDEAVELMKGARHAG
jgi:hypothetical protein